MNNVVLMGRLTRDPNISSVISADGDIQKASFTVAVDRMKKGEADFISCVAWRKQAEFIGKYLQKGSRVCLRGHLQTGSYTNKDGIKIYTTDVMVDQVEFAETKAERTQQAEEMPPDAFMLDPLEDEGLPFK